MKETDKIKMEINIAGERLPLTVPFLQQNAVRDTERRVSDLFQAWTARFPGKKPREILAMVAYHFAYQYNELSSQTDSALAAAEELDDRLTNILRNTAHVNSEADTGHSDSIGTDFFTSF